MLTRLLASAILLFQYSPPSGSGGAITSAQLAGIASMHAFHGNHGGSSCGGTSTCYLLSFSTTLGTIQSNSQMLSPLGGTLKNLYVVTSTSQPSTGSLVITVITCTPTAGACSGSASNITVTMAANTTANIFSDTTHTATVSAGDFVAIQVVNNASTGAAGIKTWGLQLTY